MESKELHLQIWSKENSYYGPTTRSIEIMGEITNELAAKVIGQVMTLELMDSTAPVSVFINSYGGDFYSGLAIFDMLRMIKCPVVTNTIGFCGSAALVIATAGDYRTATPSSTFFYHNVISLQTVDSVEAGDEMYMHYKTCNKKMKDLISNRLKLNTKEFENIFGASTTHKYINTSIAKKIGLINQIKSFKNK